ncbi:hypothetical protein ACFVFJ_45655 [Streptomyces sp. NPDC057717]|uniref:hypothetical protein n=1 Tax=Streptomyces sp. NPDC057717 TaxID=3346224 RepID=UPI003686A4CE
MADSAAIYGLVGAVGGALIGAGGAVYGPLLLHRRTSQHQQEQSRAQETMRRSEDQAVRKDAEVARIINVRATLGGWIGLLQAAFEDLEAGCSVDIDHFDEAIANAREEAGKAIDQALVDGMWISGLAQPTVWHDAPNRFEEQRLSYQEQTEREEQSDGEYRWSPGGGQWPRIIEAFDLGTRVLRRGLTQGSLDDEDLREEVESAMSRVFDARLRLSNHLLVRLEQIMGARLIVV